MRHPSEKVSKSTGVHAAVMCSNATMHVFPEFPDFDSEDTLLLFPTDDSVTVDEIEDLSKYKRLVVVESQWQKTRQMMSDDRVDTFSSSSASRIRY